MAKLRTHYDNLKVARDAPDTVIRAAYKILVQKYHPDKNPGDEQAADIMRIINQSYEVLSNPKLRAEHDAWIAREEAERASFGETSNTQSAPNSPPPPPKSPRQESHDSDGPSNHEPTQAVKGFWRKLLDGDFGLAKTYWLFGMLPGFVLNIAVNLATGLPSTESTPVWLLFVIPLYMGYWVVVAIGCWRAATRYQGAAIWPALTKISIGIGWIFLAGLALLLLRLLPIIHGAGLSAAPFQSTAEEAAQAADEAARAAQEAAQSAQPNAQPPQPTQTNAQPVRPTSPALAPRMNARDLNKLAIEQINRGEYANARESLWSAAAAKPNDAEILGNLAFSCWMLGDIDCAQNYYVSSLHIMPRRGASWIGLAQVASWRGDVNAARQSLANYYAFSKNKKSAYRQIAAFSQSPEIPVLQAVCNEFLSVTPPPLD